MSMKFKQTKTKETSEKPAKKAGKKQASPPSDPSRVAILSVRSSEGTLVSCDAVLARIADGRTEIIECESFVGQTAIEDVRSWIEQHLAARTVVMLAGSDVICRTLKLPPASTDQLEMALRLQVENFLLGGAARWRTNSALLPTSDPDHDRIGLVVDWPISNAGPFLPSSLKDQVEVIYAPPIAALVAFVTGAILQGNPESLAVHLERATGAISIAYSDGIHSAFRTLREDGTDETEWRASVIRSTSETLILADIPEQSIQPALDALNAVLLEQSDGLIAPLAGSFPSFRTLAESSSTDDLWWQRNGILIGTAVALSGPLARIASLKEKVAVQHKEFFARMVAAASTPKIAIRIAVAALFLIAIAPPALSGSRLLYLQWFLPDAPAYERTLIRTDKQNAMYRDYEKIAWPMGKLLSDLASCTPEGIELESIALTQGSPMTVQGNAKPQGGITAAEAILLMERQLRESRVFDRIEKNWDAPNANGVLKFTISATVANPLLVANYPETQDFAARTLRDRRYGPAVADVRAAGLSKSGEATSSPINSQNSGNGEEPPPDVVSVAKADASTPIAPKGSAASESGTETGDAKAAANSSDSRSLQRRSLSAGTAAPDAARRGRGGNGDDSTAIPPPLSTQQISAMTQAEARETLGRVSKARGSPGIDPAVEARLREEFYLLLEQAKKK